MGGRGSGGHNRKSAKRKAVEGHAGKRNPRHPRKSRKKKKTADLVPAGYSGPLGLAPRHLNAKAKKIWYELAAIVPAGVVEQTDRWAFELLVCLMQKFREGWAKSGEVTQIANLLARLGMTPSDRSRVNPSQPVKPPSSPFDEFTSRPQ